MENEKLSKANSKNNLKVFESLRNQKDIREMVNDQSNVLEENARLRIKVDLLQKENNKLHSRIDLVKGVRRREDLEELFELFERLNVENSKLKKQVSKVKMDNGQKDEVIEEIEEKYEQLELRIKQTEDLLGKNAQDKNTLLESFQNLKNENMRIQKYNFLNKSNKERVRQFKENVAIGNSLKNEKSIQTDSKKVSKKNRNKKSHKKKESFSEEIFLKACKFKEELKIFQKKIDKLEKEKRILKQLLKSKGVDVESDLFSKLGILKGDNTRTERLKRISQKFKQLI